MADDTPTNSPPSSDVARDPSSRSSTSSAREVSTTPDPVEVERSTWAPVPPARRELRPSEPALPASQVETSPPPPRLLYERAHEPSEDSPILYRERAYVVDGLQSDEELAEHLLAELGAIREEWRDRDSSQFVQLASFDHVFETEPNFPPLATLSWKDWHGRAEVWVRGVRHSGAPDGLLDLPDDPESERGFDASDDVFDPETRPREPVLDRASALDAPPPSHVTVELSGDPGADPLPLVSPPVPATDHVRTRSTDSGTSWQSPSRSGEYPIPQLEEEAAPPSSQRVLAGEELIGALFEGMHELLYLPDIAAGARFVLEMIEEHIPCAGALVHVFDLDARQFVVVRALGPRANDVLLARGAGSGSQLEEALRRQLTLRVDGSRQRLWETLGLTIERGLCSPVHQRGRYLGAIELGRAPGDGDFSDAEVSAVEYICEQFADFVADRPLELDPESLRPPPSA